MFRTVTLTTLAILWIACSPVTSATEPWAPTTVSALSVSGAVNAVIVSWTPGAQVADSYDVYGVSGGTLTFLAVATGDSAQVPAGYASYAVSGVLHGSESQAVGEWPICSWVGTDPPSVHVGCVVSCEASAPDLCVACDLWDTQLRPYVGDCWIR